MSDSRTRRKECVHYWIIDSPDSRTSIGRCKYCGMVAEFSNDWHDALTRKEAPAENHEVAVDI